MRFSRFTAAAVTLIFVASCKEAPTEPGTLAEGLVPQMNNAGPGMAHFVSVGSPDVSATGDPVAAFSLVALQRGEDGPVSGQWQDSWGGGRVVHVAVDCVVVDGNKAVVGGVITHAAAGSTIYTVGRHAVTAVQDNGTSANDPPDQISRTYIGGCQVPFESFPLYDLVGGQVEVR
jgi:hypothetical protein